MTELVLESTPDVMFRACAAHLSRAEVAEVGIAAMNYPQALARALNVHAGESFEPQDFARLMLRIARDVNARKGLAS